LLAIEKNKSPRCFKGVKTLSVQYIANRKAWMTSVIFCDWLLSWDKELKRPILLLVDRKEEEDGDNECDYVPPPTHKKMEQALSVIRRGVLHYGQNLRILL